MFKKIKQMFCIHKPSVYFGTYLEKQNDGSWITRHKWKCKKCGKVIKK